MECTLLLYLIISCKAETSGGSRVQRLKRRLDRLKTVLPYRGSLNREALNMEVGKEKERANKALIFHHALGIFSFRSFLSSKLFYFLKYELYRSIHRFALICKSSCPLLLGSSRFYMCLDAFTHA